MRFAIDIRAKHSAVKITLQHQEQVQEYSLERGSNTIIFDIIIYDPGEHKLVLNILECIGILKICDLRINGLSVGLGIYNCVYTTKSNISKNNILALGEQGHWTYSCDTPVHEHTKWRIGLV